MKITAICSEYPGVLEPSHGFGVVINENLLFDSCTKEAADSFKTTSKIRPKVGVVGVPRNPHHIGGFEVFNIPLVEPKYDVDIVVGGHRYRILAMGRENVVLANDVVISPCGLFTIPYGKLSQRGVKARCIVGALGGTAHNPYLIYRVVGELKSLGVRCIVAIHTAPQLVKELEKKFNIYRVGAGSTLDL